MLFNELNEDNFLLFAIKNYENPQAVTREDFEKDLNHFRYVKRLLKKYKNTGQLKVHLILNHFIILYNVFGEAATPMLFHKIEIDLWQPLPWCLVSDRVQHASQRVNDTVKTANTILETVGRQTLDTLERQTLDTIYRQKLNTKGWQKLDAIVRQTSYTIGRQKLDAIVRHRM